MVIIASELLPKPLQSLVIDEAIEQFVDELHYEEHH